MITAIIPLRLSRDRLYDEVSRLDRIATNIPPELYRLLIVDFGTPSERVAELTELAGRHNHIDIHRVDTDDTFSIGRARDIGVQQAKTPVFVFHDVDFICSTATYRRIYQRAKLRELEKNAYDFFCVPTIYLTGIGTAEYLRVSAETGDDGADIASHDWVLRSRPGFVEHHTTGSSALVMNRYAYLVLGGHDPAFVGHGAEDFELYHRLADAAQRWPRPDQYYDNIVDFSSSYRGFRALFAQFGLDLWMSGLCMVHLHHPRREATEGAYRRSSENFKTLKNRMMEFDKTKRGLLPLRDPNFEEKTLLLMGHTTMPAKSLMQALPALGDYHFLEEAVFRDEASLIGFVRDEAFSQVLFLNPYGNAYRLQLYKACQREGIRTIAFDRGGLPDSWFFDRLGFLGSSLSYSPERWDHPLPSDRQERVRKWISDFKREASTLEPNEDRQGVDYWRRSLGIGSRKVVLVALQRPADTATVFFSGPVGSSDNFIKWIEILSERLDRRKYVIVVKKHPLETVRPEIDGVIFPRDSANINDLVDLASVVVTINSGVGQIALIQGKPVVVCGAAYYQHDGLAYAATSPEELVELVHSELRVCSHAVERFTSYLIEEFYSFGRPRYSTKYDDDGSIRKTVYHIDFQRLTSLCESSVELGSPPDKLQEKSYLLRVSGFKQPAPKDPAKSSPSVANGASAQKTAAKPEWSAMRRAVHLAGLMVLTPVLSEQDRRRLKHDPVDYLRKAKWPPNRMLGRLLLDKSERPY